MDGAVAESPFAAASERIIGETELELQETVLDEAVPGPVKADVAVTEQEDVEAA